MQTPMVYSAHHQVADKALFDADAFFARIKDEVKPIPYLKEVLATTQARLNERFHEGDDIRTLVYGRAWILDCILAGIWQRFDWPDAKISLIAVGGFGRGELHPYSDIDILILMDGITPESFGDTISEFLTLLWDINLDIGSSVRTLEECYNEGKTDITIATNLVESRTIVGPISLQADLYVQVTSEGAWTDKEFFLAKVSEQKARHKKTNNTEYNLEPNLKNSPGGLRDLQTIGWVAKRHFGSTYIRDLVDDGFLTESELDTLDKSELYLWKIRYALHMITGRHEDRLLFDHQRSLAPLFGYEDSEGKLAVEQFMGQYYRTVKTLSEFNSMLLQHFEEAILNDESEQVITPLNKRFQINNGLIEVVNDKVFSHSPFALMEMFVLLAQNSNIQGVRASTIRLIRNQRVELVDDDFRNDIRNTSLFLELLRSPDGVTTELMRMNRLGILGLYLPEFGKIIGQMQHDLFHIYTVDAHTLELIRLTRQFRHNDMREVFPIAHRIVRSLPKIELLYIAALYHDVAKGRGGDHSELGAEDVLEFCKRHRMGEWDSHMVSWLVRNHLLMSMTAQRKDLSDPDVIKAFAQKVQGTTHLDYLCALTIGDINATNHTLWNTWRATLMRTLYTQTRRLLRSGHENPTDQKKLVEQVQAEARTFLSKYGIDPIQINAFWDRIGNEYFIRESAQNISWHTKAILEHRDPDIPLVLIQQTSMRLHEGATEIFVYTHDQKNLFAASVSTLDQLGLSIQDARIILTDDGKALNTFTVLTEDNEPLSENPDYLLNIEARLIEELDDPEDYPDIIERRVPRLMKLFAKPASVIISNDANTHTTVLEVNAPDRPGLLARIGAIFADFNLSVRNARITSIGESVEDFFYVTDANGRPISDPELCQALQKAICDELDAHANG